MASCKAYADLRLITGPKPIEHPNAFRTRLWLPRTKNLVEHMTNTTPRAGVREVLIKIHRISLHHLP